MARRLPVSSTCTTAPRPARRAGSTASRIWESSASMSSSSPRAFCASGLPIATSRRSGPGMARAGTGPGVDSTRYSSTRGCSVRAGPGWAGRRRVSQGSAARASSRMSTPNTSGQFRRVASATAALSAAATGPARKARPRCSPICSSKASSPAPPWPRSRMGSSGLGRCRACSSSHNRCSSVASRACAGCCTASGPPSNWTVWRSTWRR